MTGAQYNLHPETISVRLRESKSQSAIAQARPNATKDFVDELNKLDQLLIDKKVTPEEYAKLREALFKKYQS